MLWGPSRHLGSSTAANWVSFDLNVSCSSCWGYSLINTLKLKKNKFALPGFLTITVRFGCTRLASCVVGSAASLSFNSWWSPRRGFGVIWISQLWMMFLVNVMVLQPRDERSKQYYFKIACVSTTRTYHDVYKHVTWIAGVPSSRATSGFPKYCVSTRVRFGCTRSLPCGYQNQKKWPCITIPQYRFNETKQTTGIRHAVTHTICMHPLGPLDPPPLPHFLHYPNCVGGRPKRQRLLDF